MSQFYSNLVCGAGCSQPAACVEWSGYEYPDAPWSGLLLPAVIAEKGQGMSTLTHGGVGCSQPAVVAEKVRV